MNTKRDTDTLQLIKSVKTYKRLTQYKAQLLTVLEASLTFEKNDLEIICLTLSYVNYRLAKIEKVVFTSEAWDKINQFN